MKTKNTTLKNIRKLPNNKVFSTFEVNVVPAEVLFTTNKINYVWHMADIHIRANTKTLVDEHKTVFINLLDSMYDDITTTHNDIDNDHLIKVINTAKILIDKQIQNVKDKVTPLIQDSVIIICGDILHNHNNYDDLAISVLRSWIRALTYVSKVFIIGGNHDYHLYELGRQALDSLLDIDNVHVLLESKNYVINNDLVLNVFSLHDKKLPNLAEKICNNKLNIAIYHGKITSTTSQPDTKLTYDSLPLEAFNSCDYGFFGDRHTMEYLDKSKRFAYSSSLVQIHVNEHLTNHGYLYWSLITGISEYRLVKNKYGRVRFTFENNELTDAPILADENIIHCRCINSNVDLCKNIAKKYVTEQGKNHIKTVAELVVKPQEPIGIEYDHNTDSLASGECQIKLINEYVKHCLDKQDDIFMNDIFKIHSKLFNEIDKTPKLIHNQNFSVRRFYFNNIYSFGPNNMIDFTDVNNVIGVTGPNYVGKSNIFKALIWSIFAPEEKNPKGVINNESNGQILTLVEIEQNGVIYAILRANALAFKKNPKEFTVDSYTKMIVELLVYDSTSDTYGKYNDKFTAVQTEHKITEICGDEDNLRNLYFMMQTSKKSNFIDKSASAAEAFQYFSQHYDWHIYDTLWRRINNMINEKQTLIKDLDKKLSGGRLKQTLTVLEEKLSYDSDKILNLEKKREEINNKLIQIREKCAELQMKSTSEHMRNKYPELATKTIKELESIIVTVHNNITCNQQVLNKNMKGKKFIQDEIDETEKLRSEIFNNISRKINTTLSYNNNSNLSVEQFSTLMLDKELNEIESKVLSFKTNVAALNLKLTDMDTEYFAQHINNTSSTITQLQDLITVAKNKKIGVDLIAAFNDITSKLLSTEKLKINKSIQLNQKQLQQYQKKYDNLKTKQYKNLINYLKSEQSDSDSNNTTDEIMALIEQINTCDTKIKDLFVKKHGLDENYHLCDSEHKKYIDEADTLEEIITSIKTNQLIEDKINEMLELENKLIQKLTKINNGMKKLSNDIVVTETKIVDFSNNTKISEQYENDVIKYKWYRNMVSPNGIPKLILQNVIHKTEAITNEILSIFSSVSIKFAIEDGNPDTKKDHEAYPKIKINTIHKIPIDLTEASSGFQTFILNYSIREAIICLFGIKGINFIFLDEFLSSLDAEKIDNLDIFFAYITQKYDACFVISHNKAVTSHYKHQINVSPNNEVSCIESNSLDKLEISEYIKYLIDTFVLQSNNRKIQIKHTQEDISDKVKQELNDRIAQNSVIQIKNLHNKTLQIQKKVPLANVVVEDSVIKAAINEFYEMTDETDKTNNTNDTNSTNKTNNTNKDSTDNNDNTNNKKKTNITRINKTSIKRPRAKQQAIKIQTIMPHPDVVKFRENCVTYENINIKKQH